MIGSAFAVRVLLLVLAILNRGIRDLRRITAEDGTFVYTFFKAKAVK